MTGSQMNMTGSHCRFILTELICDDYKRRNWTSGHLSYMPKWYGHIASTNRRNNKYGRWVSSHI
jgi:hypothetical protein